MKDKKLRKELGIVDTASVCFPYYRYLTTDRTGYIPQIFARLSKLEDMMNKLFAELGYEYQTQCSEGLPKLKKKTKKEEG